MSIINVMSFDQHEWVRDIVTGAIAGALAGAAGASIVPDSSIVDAVAAGGANGLVFGLLVMPVKWLLARLGGPDRPSGKEES